MWGRSAACGADRCLWEMRCVVTRRRQTMVRYVRYNVGGGHKGFAGVMSTIIIRDCSESVSGCTSSSEHTAQRVSQIVNPLIRESMNLVTISKKYCSHYTGGYTVACTIHLQIGPFSATTLGY